MYKRETVHCDVMMGMSYIIMYYWVSKLSRCYLMRIIIIIIIVKQRTCNYILNEKKTHKINKRKKTSQELITRTYKVL